MKTLIASLLLVASIGALSAPAADGPAKKAPKTPQEQKVDGIVRQTNYVAYYQGRDGRARVRMTIVDSRKNERHREFVILRRDMPDPKARPEAEAAATSKPATGKAQDSTYTGDQKFYVYFIEPPDVNKTVFLVHKHTATDKEDNRWLYLPGLDLVKRISSADKRTSFVGSHFFYEDVSGRSIEDDTHELVSENKTYYILKNTPKKPELVEFAYYKMWIHRKTMLVVQISYYDKNGKEYRRYNTVKVKTIQGYPTVVKSQMSDLRNNERTVMEYKTVQYDVHLPDDIFTERYLKRPPQKHLE